MNMAVNTPMIRHTCAQGSDEWHELRGKYRCASEAPVVMGCHPNMRRDELLEAKATQSPKEFSRYTVEKIFAKGHEAEDRMRPLVEYRIGEELFPIIGTRGEYLASYDGLTMMDNISWENKQHNAELAASVEADNLPPYIYWQLEHQLLVNPDLETVIFTVGNGDSKDFPQMEYTAVPGRREQLIAAWDQFEQDRANFKATEKTAEAVGVRPDSLPVLNVEVRGELTTIDNVEEFRAASQAMIASIKTVLVTDQDFADATVTINWLEAAEAKIDLIKEQIAEKAKISDLLSALDDIQQVMMRATRLKLSRQVDTQKTNRRNQIAQDGEKQLAAFLAEANAEFAEAGVTLTGIKVDFYLVIKGKWSFALMVSAVNDAIAAAKIQTNEIAGKVRKNLALLAKHAEHDFLFSNKQVLAYMEPDHLALTIKSRIAEYAQKTAASEAARVQEHKNVIAMVEAAGENIDDVPYHALKSTRERINRVTTSTMEEFAIKADNVKAATLAKVDARLAELREQEAARIKLAPASPAARSVPANPLSGPPISVLAPNDPIPGLDDLDNIHDHTSSEVKKPNADQIIAYVGAHWSVPFEVAEGWLRDLFGDQHA